MVLQRLKPGVNYDDSSDAQIIAASCAEPQLFGLIFRRHFRAIYGFLNHRLDPSLAEEAASEVFEIALTSRAKFVAQHDTALPWLYGIATNVVAKKHRSAERQTRAYTKQANHSVAPEVGVSTGSINRVHAHSTASKLKPFLSSLSARDQSILHLFVYNELEPGEIAAELKMPSAAVRSRLHRLRKQLRSKIQKIEGELA